MKKSWCCWRLFAWTGVISLKWMITYGRCMGSRLKRLFRLWDCRTARWMCAGWRFIFGVGRKNIHIPRENLQIHLGIWGWPDLALQCFMMFLVRGFQRLRKAELWCSAFQLLFCLLVLVLRGGRCAGGGAGICHIVDCGGSFVFHIADGFGPAADRDGLTGELLAAGKDSGDFNSFHNKHLQNKNNEWL